MEFISYEVKKDVREYKNAAHLLSAPLLEEP